MIESRPRPREELGGTGVRKVPIFTATTSGSAFLRFKKPQSEFLSRVLRDKLKQKVNRMDNISKIEDLLEWAKGEEMWDRMVERETGVEVGEGSWSRDLLYARQTIWNAMNTTQRRDREMARKFLEISEQEKALWEKERALRKHEKNMERKERRQREAEHKKS